MPGKTQLAKRGAREVDVVTSSLHKPNLSFKNSYAEAPGPDCPQGKFRGTFIAEGCGCHMPPVEESRSPKPVLWGPSAKS